MSLRMKPLTLPEAMDHADQLEDKTCEISDGMQVFSGIHPEHGAIHVVIPLAGDSMMLLPFAIRQFDD